MKRKLESPASMSTTSTSSTTSTTSTSSSRPPAPSHTETHAQLSAFATLTSAVSANSLARASHPSSPLHFMESELAVFSALSALSFLPSAPEVYTLAVSSGLHTTLPSLLAHPNSDILAAVLPLLDEITDPDGVSTPDDRESTRAFLSSLVQEGGLLPAVLHAMGVLLAEEGTLVEASSAAEAPRSPQGEDAAEAVYHGLAVVDHLVEWEPQIATLVLAETSPPLLSLLAQMTTHTVVFDELKMYAAEVWAIVANADPDNASAALLNNLDLLDGILHSLAAYREHSDTLGMEEEEYVNNLIDVVCASLFVSVPVADAFVSLEGIELASTLIESRGVTRKGALKMLDFALLSSPAAASALLSSGSLGVLFGAFLSTKAEKEDAYTAKIKASLKAQLATLQPGDPDFAARKDELKKEAKTKIKALKSALRWYDAEADTEHVVSALASTLLWLDGLPLARVVRKFVDGSKVKRLATLFTRFAFFQVPPLDDPIRIEPSFFTFQRLILIIAALWVHAVPSLPEGEGEEVRALLSAAGMAVTSPIVTAFLQDYASSIGISGVGEGEGEGGGEVGGEGGGGGLISRTRSLFSLIEM